MIKKRGRPPKKVPPKRPSTKKKKWKEHPDIAWAETDGTGWYQLWEKPKIGPFPSIVEAATAMDIARERRDRKRNFAAEWADMEEPDYKPMQLPKELRET